MGGETDFRAWVGMSRWRRALAALATATALVAAASPTAIAAAPSRQGRMPSYENRPYRGHGLPRPPNTQRPPPSQAEITQVIHENRDSIRVCHYRALARDDSLTKGGQIVLRLSIGISGRVKHVVIDGPARLRVLEPCIEKAVSRWVFPPASEEYGTEFPFVLPNDDAFEPPAGCSITVNTIPWSEVWIDGQNTTLHTPLVGYRVPCGKHSLGFKRHDLLIDHTEIITVSRGKRFIHRYALTTDD